MVPPLLNHQRQRELTVRFVVYLYPDVFPKLGRILNPGYNMFSSMQRRFRSFDGCFASIYRRFRSMHRRFLLTCLRSALMIHHNNEYRKTKGTLSLRRNHCGSHFLPFFSPAEPFLWGELLRQTGLWCLIVYVHRIYLVAF